MTRRFARACAAAAVLLACAATVHADLPDVIVLSKPGVFGSPSRAPVRFTHLDHMSLENVDCLTCHHEYTDGKNVLDPGRLTPGDPSAQCSACHARPRALEAAFHTLCMTCHDAEKRKGRVTGPRTCGECHAWRK